MDRQDIDALLIGALYGELTPADEARLAAHLDSHPTDRGALDDLKSARQAVRESRIFELQVDPPQAVSALLLQEAHRRAPKRAPEREEKESWFYRFSRMFLAHPAMAAAAMLVLVVGVAGTLYMKKGSDNYADKQVAAPVAPANTMAETPTAQDPAANEGIAGDNGVAQGSGAGSSFGYQVQLADKKDDSAEAKLEASDRADQVARLKAQQNQLERQQELAKNKKVASSSIIVDTPQREPKELDEPRAKTATAKVSGTKKGNVGGEDEIASDGFESRGVATGSTASHAGAGGGGAVGGATGTGAPGGRVATTPPAAAGPARNAPGQAAPAPAPPPPPAATTAPAPATVAQTQPKAPAAKPTTPAKPTVTKEAEKSEQKPDSTAGKDATLLAWAKGQHSQAQSLAGKGDCAAAAKVAVQISNRAPEYYSQNVATDRALKKCQAYIAAERDADAERSGKARAQKRVNADQPAEAAPAH